MSELTHLDAFGRATMVDVAGKQSSQRKAVAQAVLRLPSRVEQALRDSTVPKGDVFATARVAGIQAAKKCSDLIPLCHPLALSSVGVDFVWQDSDLAVTCSVGTTGVTGVEMEALTGVSVAALTIYDMCKGLDKGITFKVELISKSGGKSGDWHAEH
jgi:cyclic pyranopterin monophosphate synthase